MGTTWHFLAFEAGESTAIDASDVVTLNSASAISFGGGVRSDFQTNISLNSWNTAMHYALNTAEASEDCCDNSHLWPLTPTDTDISEVTFEGTGCALAGEYIADMADDSPDPARGIVAKFVHTDFDVSCYPCYIWAGFNEAVSDDPENCKVAITELGTATPSWSTPKSGSKLTLTSKLDAGTAHSWSFGIGIMPTVVGHNGSNRIKIETTYY